MKHFQLNPRTPPTLYLRLIHYTRGLAKVIDGVVLLFSLGYILSDFDYSLCRYEAKMYFKTLEKTTKGMYEALPKRSA